MDKLHVLRVSVKMGVTCTASYCMYGTNLTRNRNLYVLVVNTVTNLRLLKKRPKIS